MCGIAGALHLSLGQIPDLNKQLNVMNQLQRHRGPDGEGIWIHPRQQVGFAHRRLSIVDLTTGNQPMRDPGGNWVTYNGEIYNYVELRQELGLENFVTTSDTEVILHTYRRWGQDCVSHFKGMFAFALWDEARQVLFCARDRFGIKPFYYTIIGEVFYFASEIKALLPFIDAVETDLDGLKDYLTFQFCLDGKTLFRGVNELNPAHTLSIAGGSIQTKRYWEVYFNLDYDRTARYFEEKLRSLLEDSVRIHLRSDVPVGSYISGGLDSSTVASLAMKYQQNGDMVGFIGKFSGFGPEYDESRFARALADWLKFDLYEIDITAADFIENMPQLIYHLDYPVAGPGSFPQYMVSQLAARYRKVVLGGQGGDETFGGYTRYLVAYFEQCIRGAIDGTMDSGNFIVTYESIIPNLIALRNYKPMLQEFWREGLFEDMDHRYFRLVNRAASLGDEIRWELLGDYSPFETFRRIFNSDNVCHSSYFDLMTHFDFKTLLPALLQVEDRMSMAHGLESRVPLLDHPLIELAATIPSNIKFQDGNMKYIFKQVAKPFLPEIIVQRQDKMGFPTPLTEWIQGEANEFVCDIFSSAAAQSRALIDNRKVLEDLNSEQRFGRKIWGLLSLELWHQEFHDKQAQFKNYLR
ncbi:MAG: asparagine synthase (glutamine-hydrolyzing) [Anaerolineales bacterium]|nr:asparagine synthase (glutamine-hydrolyzing) [Anaerolineales bacterium]